MPEGCDSYLPGDLVTLKGVAELLAPKPMVIKTKMPPKSGFPPGYTVYEIRLLEDNLSDYRKGHNMTVLVSDSDIVEGRCRSPDTKKWALSAEKRLARDVRMGLVKSPPAPAVPVAMTSPAATPGEFTKFTSIVDNLLGELPEKRVEEFAKTPDMALFTKVVKGEHTDAEKARFVEVADTLLGELPEKTIEQFLKTPEYETYIRVVKAAKK